MADKSSPESIPENAQDLTLFVQNLLEQMVRLRVRVRVRVWIRARVRIRR
jgi:hypothetical protein